MIQTLEKYDLFDLPELVRGHSMVSCFYITFENDKRFTWVLMMSEKMKGFSQLVNAIQLNSGNVILFDH